MMRARAPDPLSAWSRMQGPLNQRKAHVQGAGGGRRLHLRPIPAHPNSASLSNLLQVVRTMPRVTSLLLALLGLFARVQASCTWPGFMQPVGHWLTGASATGLAVGGRGRACVSGRAAAEGPVMTSTCYACAVPPATPSPEPAWSSWALLLRCGECRAD